LYARAGVAEAWLVDLVVSRLEIHRGPSSVAYRDVRLPEAEEQFAPAAFPDLVLRRRDLLGGASSAQVFNSANTDPLPAP
jgi:hypothetical protein